VKWREYHEFTKHSVESLRRTPHFLHWENMPDPFRHYEGVPVLDLPADPPDPDTPASDGPGFLSQLLFYSAAISAAKRVPSTGSTYALRVNPSSGNLHPTEFHFITRGLVGWPDGLYHYRPSSHMAEQRAIGDIRLDGFDAPILFVLTSIAWREAWKYRDRAYRYCLHDIGHAWQSLVLAAGALGCRNFAHGSFADDEVANHMRLESDEWPMLIVALRGESIPRREPVAGGAVRYGGTANRLSRETIAYPSIEAIHAATKLAARGGVSPSEADNGGCVAASFPRFGAIARTRRSALDFRGGLATMSRIQLSTILQAAAEPFCADFSTTRFVHLYLYVHRVAGLEPGVYRYHFEESRLEQTQPGDQRLAAAGLSLGQDLAGNACVAFSMIGDLDGASAIHGDRGYRYAYFEAGAIGQRMYLAAEASGLQATGIGAFYDEQVHRYLQLLPEQGQVIYHFAIGHAVPDPRLEAG
jgi:SagB-type dehydrogenase family enzyme